MAATPGAAKADGAMRPIAPSIMARVTQAVRYMLSGQPPDTWFGPSQPTAPQAQETAQHRQFDYPTAINTVWTPRSEGGEALVSFWQLRTLADSSDLVRLAIETRKDQMGRLEWLIKPRDIEQSSDDRCKALTDFFAAPDREHDWSTWLRMLLEDVLVIDAPAIYPRMNRGGGVYSLDLMDGAMFKRIIDTGGRTPVPPDPAYQQVVKGVPAVDYSRDELLYMPRNPRTNRLYGYSPVEQIIVTVNIMLRRQLHKLQFYTEGSTPDLMIGVPNEWSADQVQAFQNYFDALLSGNTAERRKARFIPNGAKPFDVKEGALKDDYDEWLARVVCYAFSLPPTAFVKQMNRATADSAQDVALEEGLAPLMQWVTSMMNQLIWRWFGFTDLCFSWQQDTEIDQLTQAQIDEIYLQNQVVTPDEVREDLGMEPLTAEQKQELSPTPPQLQDENGDPIQPQPNANPQQPQPSTKVVKYRRVGDPLKKKAKSGRSIATVRQSSKRVRRFSGY